MLKKDSFKIIEQFKMDNGVKTIGGRGNGGFLQPDDILGKLNLSEGQKVADLGCGAGFFTIPAARKVKEHGTVWAVDIQRSALSDIESKAKLEGLMNIKTVWADLEEKKATDIPDKSMDLVIVKSVLFQTDDRVPVLEEAARIVKPKSGQVLIIDWKKEVTPFGPDVKDRISEEEAMAWAKKAGLTFKGKVTTDDYHFGLVFAK